MSTTSKPPDQLTREEENKRKVDQVLKSIKQKPNPDLAKADLEQIKHWYQSGFKN